MKTQIALPDLSGFVVLRIASSFNRQRGMRLCAQSARIFAALILAFVLAGTIVENARGGTGTVTPAFTFTDSVGVNTHFSWYANNITQDQWSSANWPTIVPLMENSGIRHIRDG